jgi:hypothetical protein
MLVRTSTRTAPWCVVEGNDKYYARAKVLGRLVEALSEELGYEPADPLGDLERKAGKAAKKAAQRAAKAPVKPDKLKPPDAKLTKQARTERKAAAPKQAKPKPKQRQKAKS